MLREVDQVGEVAQGNQTFRSGIGQTMKQDWLVENEDAKKALHDLYFETGSLPAQQPKVKAKEPEKAEPQVSLPPALASLAEPVKAAEAPATPAAPESSRIKLAALVAMALGLAFVVYHLWPAMETDSPQAIPKHSRSAFVKTSLQKLQVATTPKGETSNTSSSGSLAVGPSLAVVEYVPGQSATQTITVENRTPVSLTFAMEAADVFGQTEAPVLVPAGDSSDSVAASAVFSQKFVQVEPMHTETVEVTLTFPQVSSVSGVLVRLRSTDNLPLGASDTMTASLGTMIAFAHNRNANPQSPNGATSAQAAKTHFTVSQWSIDSSSAPERAGQIKSNPNTSNGAAVAAVRP